MLTAVTASRQTGCSHLAPRPCPHPGAAGKMLTPPPRCTHHPSLDIVPAPPRDTGVREGGMGNSRQQRWDQRRHLWHKAGWSSSINSSGWHHTELGSQAASPPICPQPPPPDLPLGSQPCPSFSLEKLAKAECILSGCCTPHPPDAPPAAAAQRSTLSHRAKAAAGAQAGARAQAVAGRSSRYRAAASSWAPAKALPPPLPLSGSLAGRGGVRMGTSVPPAPILPTVPAEAARPRRARTQMAALGLHGGSELAVSTKPQTLPAPRALPAPHSCSQRRL